MYKLYKIMYNTIKYINFQFLSEDELDSQMARKKFDSEESDSESEANNYEDEDKLTSASQLEDYEVDENFSTEKIY